MGGVGAIYDGLIHKGENYSSMIQSGYSLYSSSSIGCGRNNIVPAASKQLLFIDPRWMAMRPTAPFKPC